MDMHFLGNIKQLCEVCKVKRYKEEVLKYLYKEKILMPLHFFDSAVQSLYNLPCWNVLYVHESI